MIYTGWPRRGGEDSPELIIADAEASSLIDAEAKGKFIYNSPLPVRSAAAELREGQGAASLLQPAPALGDGAGVLRYLAVRTTPLPSPPSASFTHCFPLSSIFSVLAPLVIILSSIISIIPGFSSGPFTSGSCILEETEIEQYPRPSRSSGNATSFSLSAGEGVCV